MLIVEFRFRCYVVQQLETSFAEPLELMVWELKMMSRDRLICYSNAFFVCGDNVEMTGIGALHHSIWSPMNRGWLPTIPWTSKTVWDWHLAMMVMLAVQKEL